MLKRCYCERDIAFDHYGGRGIQVCEEWRSNYHAFRDWSLANSYDETKTIDRFPDRDGNYCPSNCRWATILEQARNKDAVIVVEYQGQSRPLIEWCELLGISHAAAKQRFYGGKPVEEIFSPDRAGMPKGQMSHAAILTDGDVVRIREKRMAGEKLDSLAEEYSVSRSTIDLACRGKTFAHLPNPVPKRQSTFHPNAPQAITQDEVDAEIRNLLGAQQCTNPS